MWRPLGPCFAKSAARYKVAPTMGVPVDAPPMAATDAPAAAVGWFSGRARMRPAGAFCQIGSPLQGRVDR